MAAFGGETSVGIPGAATIVVKDQTAECTQSTRPEGADAPEIPDFIDNPENAARVRQSGIIDNKPPPNRESVPAWR